MQASTPTVHQPPDDDVLALSAERDLWELRLLAQWRAGYRAAELAHADDFDAGFAAGIAAYKAAQHDLVRLLDLEMIRWGGWREDFGKPRAGDFPGRGEAA